jgi:hypothetical protein
MAHPVFHGRVQRPGDPVVHVTVEQHNLDKYMTESRIATVEERLTTSIRMLSVQLEALDGRVRQVELSSHDTGVRVDAMRMQQAAPVQVVVAGAGDSDISMRGRLVALDNDLTQSRKQIREVEDQRDVLRRKLASTQDGIDRHQLALRDYGERTSQERMLALTDQAMRSFVLAPVAQQAITSRMHNMTPLDPIRSPEFGPLPDTDDAIRRIIESFRPSMQALAPPGYQGPRVEEPTSDYDGGG